MRLIVLAPLLLMPTIAAQALAASLNCEDALIQSTYNRISSDHLDWRLASFVSQTHYEQIKHDAGASAVIYGVPVGASYADFQQRLQQYQSSHQESLTHDQALNILWTGLDPNATSAYSECLRTQALTSGGLHLAVKGATLSDIVLVAIWRPEGSAPTVIRPEWKGMTAPPGTLPRQLTSGQTPIVVKRPNMQRTLAVAFPGYGDSVTLDPLPPAIPPPTAHIVAGPTESYRAEVASGHCKDFGNFQTVETPNKPDGWSIVHSDFRLEGDRTSCGAFSHCDQLIATETKVKWQFNTQGEDQECGHSGNTGIHTSAGVLTVVWQHPE